MPKPQTSPGAGEWITYREAAEMLGLDIRTLWRMVGKGAFTVRKLPRCSPRLNRAAIERMMAESVRPRAAD